MSRADDNTNDLESYGVWVKNSSGTENEPQQHEATTESLPDFDDADFSDMFRMILSSQLMKQKQMLLMRKIQL